MPYHVVDVAGRPITCAVVRCRNIHVRAAHGEEKRLLTISDCQQPVWAPIVDQMAQNLELKRRAFEACRLPIRIKEALDTADDREAVSTDGPHRVVV